MKCGSGGDVEAGLHSTAPRSLASQRHFRPRLGCSGGRPRVRGGGLLPAVGRRELAAEAAMCRLTWGVRAWRQ
jgi:hypothetical protein